MLKRNKWVSYFQVFISKKTATVVSEHFSVIETDVKHQVMERENFDVDYKLLEMGEPKETRFVLGKVIMDTMNNGVLQDQNVEVFKVVKHRPSLSKLFT